MKYLILGGGPAGLSFANALLQRGRDNFIVLEANKEAGGLCRSRDVDGSPLDIGGGHFLDVRRQKVDGFLFGFMPIDEWDMYVRNSQIEINGHYLNHPFEANIWQLDIDSQVEYLKSIAAAGCNTGMEMPKEFVPWIFWKLGNKIAENYMIPYNQKMFGENLNKLGTYWMEKLPNVSFEDTLRSCLMHKAYGQQPGHAKFYYPKKYGYGELWSRMAQKLGDHIEYQKKVSSIDFSSKSVKTVDGSNYRADVIVTTIPWTDFLEITGMPDQLKSSLRKLKHSSIQVQYFGENLDTTAQWVYYPDPELSYHRILVRSNFCQHSKGYWTETNTNRIGLSRDNSNTFINEYAYPLNTIDKPAIMKNVLTWAQEQNVYGLGRWGEHQHYNSDLVVQLALNLAEKFCGW